MIKPFYCTGEGCKGTPSSLNEAREELFYTGVIFFHVVLYSKSHPASVLLFLCTSIFAVLMLLFLFFPFVFKFFLVFFLTVLDFHC